MANVDKPRGFRPYGELKHVGIYVAGETIYPGDAVKQGAGDAVTTRLRTEVVRGANGDALIGVAMNYATDGQMVRVADSPDQLFSAQGDATEYATQDNLGTNAGIVATAGDTTYKTSRMEVDTSDINTTATLALKVLGVVPREDGKNVFGGYVELIVKINNHQLGSHTGTAGV